VILYLDVPGKQLIDTLGRVIGDAHDEGAEIRFGVEAVQLRGFDDGVDRGGSGRGVMAAVVAS